MGRLGELQCSRLGDLHGAGSRLMEQVRRHGRVGSCRGDSSWRLCADRNPPRQTARTWASADQEDSDRYRDRDDMLGGAADRYRLPLRRGSGRPFRPRDHKWGCSVTCSCGGIAQATGQTVLRYTEDEHQRHQVRWPTAVKRARPCLRSARSMGRVGPATDGCRRRLERLGGAHCGQAADLVQSVYFSRLHDSRVTHPQDSLRDALGMILRPFA